MVIWLSVGLACYCKYYYYCVFRIFCQFTMETILATAFGCQVNILKEEGSALTEAAAEIFFKNNTPAGTFNEMLCCMLHIT